jgi:hypothetical protein
VSDSSFPFPTHHPYRERAPDVRSKESKLASRVPATCFAASRCLPPRRGARGRKGCYQPKLFAAPGAVLDALAVGSPLVLRLAGVLLLTAGAAVLYLFGAYVVEALLAF